MLTNIKYSFPSSSLNIYDSWRKNLELYLEGFSVYVDEMHMTITTWKEVKRTMRW